MTEEVIVIKRFKSFILGRCQCPCNQECSIRTSKGVLRRYISGHNPVDISKRRTYSKENNPAWKGGIKKKGRYLAILRHNHKYCDYWGYVFLHRYRMELMIGRYLTEEEVVHHIDGNRKNNDESNLMLFANHSEHMIYERANYDMSGRVCKLCKSKKTYINKKGRPVWCGNKIDGWVCKNCHWREWYRLTIQKKQMVKNI